MITLAQLPAGHPGRRFLTGLTTWFAVGSDPRFSYGLYVPDGFVPSAPWPVVVAIHGSSRTAQELRQTWASFAEQHRAVVVAPLFPAGISSADDLHGYKNIKDGGTRYDLVLFDLLDEAAARWGLNVSRVLLAGHSGGGQFAARMLLLHPGRLAGVVVSAPGRVTLIDPARPWPAGTADAAEQFGIVVDPAQVADVPTLLTVGADDLGTADLQAQHDASQDGYGSTRIARLETLAANLRANGAEVSLQTVPGASHHGNATQAAAERFLADLVGRRRS